MLNYIIESIFELVCGFLVYEILWQRAPDGGDSVSEEVMTRFTALDQFTFEEEGV